MAATNINYHLPLDIETRKIYRQWIPGMIVSNTFLVVSDFFIQARTAALLSFNFLQLYPSSSVVIVNADKEKDGICAQLKAVGILLKNIHQIKDDKQFKKQCSDGVAGVYFVTTKTILTMLAKDSLDKFDFKLMIVCGAEKADSTAGLAKVVPYSFNASKIFRILALSFALPKKISKVQSLISNLQIHRTLIKKTSDNDIGEILFNKETTFIDVKYETRELELLKLIISFCTENLVSVGIACVKNLKSLFFLDTEIWLKTIPENSEYRNLVEFTVVLIEGYKLLVQYGARALFLYFSSKSDIFDNVEEIVELKELKERLEVVNFGAFPNREKRDALQCHPKLEELYKIVNTDKRNVKFLIICSSPFGARAVTEYLVAARIKCIENVHDLYNLMADKPHLRGEEPFTAEEARKTFLQSTIPVMVSTDFVENLGMVMFEFSISMDYLTAGQRYARFGRKSFCLLTDEYETIPTSMRNYERKLSASDCNYSYNFNTVVSKLRIERPLKDYPIQYSVADLLISFNPEKDDAITSKVADGTITTATTTNSKITVESIEEGERYLKNLMGDFMIDNLDDAFYDTVDFLNEHTSKNPLWTEKYIKNINENSTQFEKSLHSSLYDPINPSHLSFAKKCPNIEFSEWDEIAETKDEQPRQPSPQQHAISTTKLKKIKSKKCFEPSESFPAAAVTVASKPVTHYYKPIEDPKLAEIKEKMNARIMKERQRWLCVIRDAKNAGKYIAVQKDVLDEIEKLPPNMQFWDCV